MGGRDNPHLKIQLDENQGVRKSSEEGAPDWYIIRHIPNASKRGRRFANLGQSSVHLFDKLAF
jgi:hypothetical protein